VGLDNSVKMLAEVGSSDERVSYCLGDARSLPLRACSVGMVFLSNVVHHLADLPKAAEGFAYVLEPGGFAVVRNYVREQLQDVPYLEFFPEAHAASVTALASGREIMDSFRRAGFFLFSHRSIRQPAAASPLEYLSKVQSRVYSDLAAISDDAFEAGVARMAAAVSHGWNRSLREPIALFSFRKGLR
jgi:ubiquinone/menaquinone biosynthesis C-methylase UbiE